MIILLLGAVIFVYLLFRVILTAPLSGRGKLLSALLLLLVSQQYALRFAFGNMASPEMPALVLLLSSWSFASLIFVFLLLLFQDVVLLPRRIMKAKKQAALPFAPGRRQFLIAALGVIPVCYAIQQGITVPEVRTLEAKLRRLPRELDGLTLVQISDLHISPLFQEQRTREVVDKVNALRPDLIFFTGDTVDGLPERRAGSISPLQQLKARYGVYGCVGNHEYYGDYAAWMKMFPALGLTMLSNSHVALSIRDCPLVVAGVTDIAAERYSLPGPDIAGALAGAPDKAVRILLAHRPGNAPKNAGMGVDLQLSGHTHGGQILGMNKLVARFNQGFLYGWYQIGAMRMYVSSGAGLWNGFPLRLGVPSEIVRIVLKSW